ncbi:MAG: hypothetical protein NZ585_07880 [Chloracidobacterium sp.]|nr:hypothetical protein [Chloracidobacterium sp.]
MHGSNADATEREHFSAASPPSAPPQDAEQGGDPVAKQKVVWDGTARERPSRNEMVF